MAQNTADLTASWFSVFRSESSTSLEHYLAFGITAIKHAVFPFGSPFGSVKNPIDFLLLYKSQPVPEYNTFLHLHACLACLLL